MEDDAGAQDAYEREADEEADIAAMEAEAVQRRAEAASAAAATNGQAAASSSGSDGPPQPGRLQLLRLQAPAAIIRMRLMCMRSANGLVCMCRPIVLGCCHQWDCAAPVSRGGGSVHGGLGRRGR